MESDRQVLLVDDNEADLFLTARLLGKIQPDLPVSTVYNGREALVYLERRFGETAAGPESATLVFLDINMPVMDGFEFLDEYQQRFSHLGPSIVVIVMLSSTDNPHELSRASAYEVVRGCAVKPLNVDEARDMLGRFLHVH